MRTSLLAALLSLLGVETAFGQAVLAPATEDAPALAPGPYARQGASNLPPPRQPPQSFDDAPASNVGALGREWQGMEYLLWWTRSTRMPAVATANTASTSAVLPNSATTILAGGGNELEGRDHSGGRFTLGVALDSSQTLGLEGNYFFLGTRTNSVGASSPGTLGSAALGVPYFDVSSATEQAQTVAFPGFARGTVTVDASSRVQGAELNAVFNFLGNGTVYLDGLVGFRYLEVDEGLQIAYLSDRFQTPSGAVGMSVGAADQFDGHNRFFGGQVGLRGELRKGRFFLGVMGKIALGDTVEVVRINGVSATARAGAREVLQRGGTLALPTNSGRFTRDMFGVVPEGSVRVGVVLRDRTRLFVGYNFLYLSELARPGDQIDRNVNATQLPLGTRGGTLFGAPAPRFSFNGSDFWAQGLVLGVEYRY